jgi:hypothetical protein
VNGWPAGRRRCLLALFVSIASIFPSLCLGCLPASASLRPSPAPPPSSSPPPVSPSAIPSVTGSVTPEPQPSSASGSATGIERDTPAKSAAAATPSASPGGSSKPPERPTSPAASATTAPATGTAATTPTPLFVDSFQAGQVARLYKAFFQRSPDPGGFNGWVGALRSGTTLEQVSNAFASSAEFVNRYGLISNDQFVNLAYTNVLSRGPDAGGFAYWMSLLAGGWSRGQVMLGFSESPEFSIVSGVLTPHQAAVIRLYRAYFQREADPTGFIGWVAALDGGAQLPEVSQSFAASAEFTARYGAVSNNDFVMLAYRNVLHREPDPAGFAFWLDQLQRGAARGQVMLGFSESVEFVQANGHPIPGPEVWDPRTRTVAGADVWASYRAGCPVGPASLRRLVLQYWDFAGALRVGEVIARDAEVPALLYVFNRAFTQRFPIWKMVRVDVYGADDVASMADGNTSAFNCRRVTGNPTKLSQHSYGNAIDINTRQNPYGTCCRIFPAGWEDYYYNRNGRQGQMMPGGIINNAMAAVGWPWGGRWVPHDWQHWSSNGG